MSGKKFLALLSLLTGLSATSVQAQTTNNLSSMFSVKRHVQDSLVQKVPAVGIQRFEERVSQNFMDYLSPSALRWNLHPNEYTDFAEENIKGSLKRTGRDLFVHEILPSFGLDLAKPLFWKPEKRDFDFDRNPEANQLVKQPSNFNWGIELRTNPGISLKYNRNDVDFALKMRYDEAQLGANWAISKRWNLHVGGAVDYSTVNDGNWFIGFERTYKNASLTLGGQGNGKDAQARIGYSLRF